MSVNWDKITDEEMEVVDKIVKRLSKLRKIPDTLNAQMDISAAHISNPLRLNDLLSANDFNFLHDVIGIMNNIDRNKGILMNGFLPRYSQ